MSRFVRKAGDTSTAYSDADVCALLPQYTGALSASNSTNVCNTRGGWERVYYETNYSGSITTVCIDVDPLSYDAFCLQLFGFSAPTTCTYLRAAISCGNCFCTCCGSAQTQRFASGTANISLTQACGADLMGGAFYRVCGGFSYGALYSNACCGTTFNIDINGTTGESANNFNNMKLAKLGSTTVPWCSVGTLKVYSNCAMCARKSVIQLLGLRRGPSDIGVS